MSNLAKIDEAINNSSESGVTETDTCQDLNELINLNLNDYCSNLKNETSEYFSSPSKSSSQDYSPLESSKYQNNLFKNNMARDTNNNFMDQVDSDQQITKLFVGNLPTSTTLPELLAVFKKYGPVNEALSVVKDHNYAFIHFYNRKDAEVALREVNDSLFKDRYIRVQFSTSQGFTNNKTKEKRRPVVPFGNQSSKFMYPNQSMPYSQSSPMLSNYAFNSNGINFGAKNNWRPITANKIPSSQSAFFDRNTQKQTNFLNQPNYGSLSQTNLLIETSKLQNVKLNPYNQFHDELQQKQQFIQALYLRQQQQLLQQQIQLQLQQQIQKTQEQLIQQPNFSIPKSNTIPSFNFGLGSSNGDKNLTKPNFNN